MDKRKRNKQERHFKVVSEICKGLKMKKKKKPKIETRE